MRDEVSIEHRLARGNLPCEAKVGAPALKSDADQRAGDCQHFGPVSRRLALIQLGRLGDVTAPPDHDGVAALDVGALQVGVRVVALQDPHAVLV
jgi:hypothetical protein